MWKLCMESLISKTKDVVTTIFWSFRYLVIVDDIWHWEQWELIRKSLPRNNLGSRIIMSTRIDAVAMKCFPDNDAFVYEIVGLSKVAAEALSERIFKETCKADIIPSDMHNPCSSIAKMSGGMPLAVICMSLAVAEQLNSREGRAYETDTVSSYSFHVAEIRALEGLINIPCLKPIVESLCLGYHDLPLHLKTCLLHCSMYPPYHTLERDDLTRMWIAEGFVYDEEEARSYADELVNRGLIQRCSSALVPSGPKYEMNAMMLHFLRCKSQEDCCNASLDRGSDMSSLHARRICRLSIQSYKNKLDIARSHVSHTHSLYLFDYAWRAPFKEFEHLRVLHLHCSHLRNADLVDICGLIWLRCLTLKGARINLLPKEIGRLKRLWILNVSNTGIRCLPREVGELQQLKILDVSNTMVESLPEEIGKLKHLNALYARNSRVKELPSQIRELQYLQRLYVSNTLVEELPMEIGELKNLKIVDPRDMQADDDGSAVTAATGAFGPVLAKLGALLRSNEDITDLDENQMDIVSIISALKSLRSFLLWMWERENIDEACKDWMTEARNQSYDMKNDIDCIMLDLQNNGDKTITRHFGRIKLQVKGLVNRYCEEWMYVDQIIISNRSKVPRADPRSHFLHKDVSELVEMEEKKSEVIELLQEHELVCIHGFAGMGKTTLADQVYQATGEQFHCRAFVSVSPRSKMTEILSSIHSEVMPHEREVRNSVLFPEAGVAVNQQDIINRISEFLKDKRYAYVPYPDAKCAAHASFYRSIRKALLFPYT
ncbi:hypothetical protein BAE44_0020080 [Dichanthelium oligosanthes]|uniref:NB-ARC domain-containing protein n=1 Tax=Dichanthelium oligosanthes TaxID=888268 RepID=A0A1E5V1A6_9POAL|nr:hypothetical protein BAE44_0020080 [Dichanthelium oligosanthes]